MFQIGIIGCILYGILFLACLYRTSVYWVVTKRADLKLLFHCFLSSCVVLEIVYFIGFIVDDRYTTWGYQFHLYSSLLHTMAYAVVVVLWAKALILSGAMIAFVQKTVCLLIFLLTVAVFWNSWVLLQAGSFDEYINDNRYASTTLWTIASLLLLGFTIWMVVYVYRVKQQVRKDMINNQVDEKMISKALWRINSIVAACFIAALLRAISLLIIIIVANFEINEMHWFIYSNWIPTIIPSIVLLFVTRPNTSESDETKENALEATSAETEARFSEMSIQSTDISESIPHTSDDRGSRMSSYANEDGMLFTDRALTFLRDTNGGRRVSTDRRESSNRPSGVLHFDNKSRLSVGRQVSSAGTRSSTGDSSVVMRSNPMFEEGYIDTKL